MEPTLLPTPKAPASATQDTTSSVGYVNFVTLTQPIPTLSSPVSAMTDTMVLSANAINVIAVAELVEELGLPTAPDVPLGSASTATTNV